MNLERRWYQDEDVRFICENPHGAILHPPGCGKTVSIVSGFLELRKRNRVRSLLVVAPTSTVLSSWPDELRKWDQFRHLRVAVLHGPTKEILARHRSDVYLINAEGLLWLKELPPEVDMVAVDESTKFRSMTSQRTKLLTRLIKDVERRFIMSGSLLDEGLEVLQGQMAIMDGGLTFGTSDKYYKETYFRKVGPFKHVPLPGAWEIAMSLIKGRVRHVTLEEAGIDLPPLTDTVVPVVMPQRAWDLHNDLRKDMVSYTGEGMVSVANKEAATTSMRQITGGAMYVNSQLSSIVGNTMTIHESKLEALHSIATAARGVGKKLAVTYVYDHERQRIALHLRDFKVSGIHGGDKDRPETIRRWNRGEIDVLLLNYQAAAHGLNLQEVATDICMFTPTWSGEDDFQVIRRFWRSGQQYPVSVWRLIVEKSMDEIVLGVVKKKYRDVAEAIRSLLS